MNYKGFQIEYSERDKLFIISSASAYIRDIVGHSETISFAQKMIDFHVNVMETKERF